MQIPNNMDTMDTTVPLQVRINLEMLFLQQKNSTGIWASQLEECYKKAFKSELLYSDWGFGSIAHMCDNLKPLFKIVKHAMGDFKIFYKDATNITSPECLLTAKDRKVPDDTVLIKRGAIPRQHLPAAPSALHIKITQIYDISKFWFYTIEDEKRLDILMNDMQLFYKSTGNFYKLPSYLIEEGLYCVAIYGGEYHRGIIANTVPELYNSVKIFYIDYGTVELTNTSSLYLLHASFQDLPAMAIRGSLAMVKPAGKNMPWTMADLLKFQHYINKGNSLYADIESVTRDNGVKKYNLKLHCKSGREKNFIHDWLIDHRTIIHIDDAQIPDCSIPEFIENRQKMNFMPPFDDIERGIAPSPYELQLLMDINYGPLQIYKKYIKY